MPTLEEEISRRRTFAIISHPDAGKTTLTEKFLLYGGAIAQAGEVKGKRAKAATSDWMEIEKQRGISVTSSVMQFQHNGFCINILDTPGHQDFSEDTYRTLMAADSAVMVIDGAKGVEPQTRKLFKVCAMRHIPIFTFVNKMDREAKDPFDLLDEVERELGVTIFLRTNRGVTLTEEGRELTAQIAPLVERSRKLERYYSERRAADRVSLSVASQRYPFCAKAFVEFLHLLDEPHIQVSFKEMEMAAVIDEVTARRSAFGIIFVSDMTEHFIGRILREKNLTFQPLVDIRPRVFLRKGHPLSGERAVRLEQLYAYPYAVFTQSDSNYHFAEEAVVGTGAEFDRVVSVSDRATAYNVMAHTDCVSTGSGVLPDGYGDDRLMTLPLIGDVPDMRLGVIRPRDVPLTDYGEKFIAILKDIVSELNQEA